MSAPIKIAKLQRLVGYDLDGLDDTEMAERILPAFNALPALLRLARAVDRAYAADRIPLACRGSEYAELSQAHEAFDFGTDAVRTKTIDGATFEIDAIEADQPLTYPPLDVMAFGAIGEDGGRHYRCPDCGLMVLVSARWSLKGWYCRHRQVRQEASGDPTIAYSIFNSARITPATEHGPLDDLGTVADYLGVGTGVLVSRPARSHESWGDRWRPVLFWRNPVTSEPLT